MKNIDMANLKAVKYFNKLDLSEVKQEQSDDIESLNEKVNLEFILQNTIDGITYSINAKLLDRNVPTYNSEQKQPHTTKEIIFENFYVCDYFFEKEQKIQITINKNNTPINVDTTLGLNFFISIK